MRRGPATRVLISTVWCLCTACAPARLPDSQRAADAVAVNTATSTPPSSSEHPPVEHARVWSTEPPELEVFAWVDGRPVTVDELRLSVRARPVRADGGWNLELSLHVEVHGKEAYRLLGEPIPQLRGESGPLGAAATSSFGDGCWTGPSDAKYGPLGPGPGRRYPPRVVDGVLPTRAGQWQRVQVGLCRVGFPDGAFHNVEGPEVTLTVSDDGVPRVTVEPSTTRRRDD